MLHFKGTSIDGSPNVGVIGSCPLHGDIRGLIKIREAEAMRMRDHTYEVQSRLGGDEDIAW
jgi:hypothetical protein